MPPRRNPRPAAGARALRALVAIVGPRPRARGPRARHGEVGIGPWSPPSDPTIGAYCPALARAMGFIAALARSPPPALRSSRSALGQVAGLLHRHHQLVLRVDERVAVVVRELVLLLEPDCVLGTGLL